MLAQCKLHVHERETQREKGTRQSQDTKLFIFELGFVEEVIIFYMTCTNETKLFDAYLFN